MVPPPDVTISVAPATAPNGIFWDVAGLVVILTGAVLFNRSKRAI
jgi:hypothetical protein